MKTLTLSALLCLAMLQLSAQTSSESTPTRQLYSSFSLHFGWSNFKTYSDIYLKPGASRNASVTLGGRSFGLNLDYFNNLYALDIERNVRESSNITGITVGAFSPQRFKIEGFLIGPYIGDLGFGYKKKFQFMFMPAVGFTATTFPGLEIVRDNGDLRITQQEVETHFAYAIGMQARYAFWRSFAIGAMTRYSYSKTVYLNKIEPVDFAITLSCGFPL